MGIDRGHAGDAVGEHGELPLPSAISRLKEKTTSSAVMTLPEWNFTSGRSVKMKSLPSTFQAVARCGATGVPFWPGATARHRR